MPELPEVEVTRLRLEPELVGQSFERVVIRSPKLRLPIATDLVHVLPVKTVRTIGRRGKYLLFFCDGGCLIIHLGMTGHLRLVPAEMAPWKHDHLDFLFTNGRLLRFNDPRKFGTVIWTWGNPLEHSLLLGIGPEPLTPAFDGAHLFKASRSRFVAVKLFIMNSAIVAGVGNIYANEALFRARINPSRPASSLDLDEFDRLAAAIRDVLAESIDLGSTFRVAEAETSYHPLSLHVYGREGAACNFCGTPLKNARLGNRSSIFCPTCQQV